ncbi:lipocalin-like domain-containing protein [Spirochaeta dissipatitropha]
MKKIFISGSLLIILGLAFLFMGCDLLNSDYPSESSQPTEPTVEVDPLIGTWEMTGYCSFLNAMDVETWTFEGDETFSWRYRTIGRDGGDLDQESSGTYSNEGSILNLEWGGVQRYNYSISNNFLTLSDADIDDPTIRIFDRK